jgi:hypothetical protein
MELFHHRTADNMAAGFHKNNRGPHLRSDIPSFSPILSAKSKLLRSSEGSPHEGWRLYKGMNTDRQYDLWPLFAYNDESIYWVRKLEHTNETIFTYTFNKILTACTLLNLENNSTGFSIRPMFFFSYTNGPLVHI